MSRQRSELGAQIIELPAALWMLFILFTFPMIDMATTTLRTSLVVTAAHEAAHAAACAKSFLVAYDAGDPSASQAAQSQVDQMGQGFSEIKFTAVTTNIVITDITSDQTTRQNSPLSQPPDTNSNTYSVEVVVTAQVNPLLTLNPNWFGSIPGLSAPVTVTCAAQQYCEYPQGLIQ